MKIKSKQVKTKPKPREKAKVKEKRAKIRERKIAKGMGNSPLAMGRFFLTGWRRSRGASMVSLMR